MHSLLFSPRSRTITKIYLPVNVPCLVNHWVVNLNNSNVLSLSNSIKVQTKVMLKNTFQANKYTIMVLYSHKLTNTSHTPLLGKRTVRDKHRTGEKTKAVILSKSRFGELGRTSIQGIITGIISSALLHGWITARQRRKPAQLVIASVMPPELDHRARLSAS